MNVNEFTHKPEPDVPLNGQSVLNFGVVCPMGAHTAISRLHGSVVNLFDRRVNVVLRLCRLVPRSVKRARGISEGVR